MINMKTQNQVIKYYDEKLELHSNYERCERIEWDKYRLKHKKEKFILETQMKILLWVLKEN